MDVITKEMNKLLSNFVTLEAQVYRELTRLGYFCDSIDPLTGCAMHTRCGKRYSEVMGAGRLLGYKVKEGSSNCPFIFHPKFGSSSYPATLFSNAPIDVLETEMERALHKLQLTRTQSSNSLASLVSMKDAVLKYGQRVVFRNLSFELKHGESLFICGPSGSGKTLLIKALCNLIALDSGEVSM